MDINMELTFYTADVFTDKRFCGNQLAVFPNAAGLGAEHMQAIAREFNFSETVFVFAPENSANTKRLRIYTPGAEVPFAGHPTIGTACVLAANGDIVVNGQATTIVFEEGVGNVPVTVTKEGERLYAELTTAQAPEFRPCVTDAKDIAAILSLSVSDLAVEDYPLQAVSCGLPFLFVPVRSLQGMQQLRINQEKWEPLLNNEWNQQLYLFTKETVDVNCQFHSRMFAFDLGFGEDPATGSAAAAFAGYLGQLTAVPDGPIRLTVEQGLEMGRPSKLFIRAKKSAGITSAIRVGGNTVLVSQGVLTL
jgi:trans-2,3-dihydro-3-hydroxyanthranilate isomerase